MIQKAEEAVPDAVSLETREHSNAAMERRQILKKLGRFAAVTAPVVTLLLTATAKPKQAQAVSLVSSRSLKAPESGTDANAILAAVAALPVEMWRYKPETELDTRSHIGPYAEDFRAAFGVGDGVTIRATDAIGVCLAAMKALSEKVATLEAKLSATRQECAT